jgi:protein-S-isoprenylcysteine O-methyltransferase Ste14
MTDQTDLVDRIAWGRARAATVMALVFMTAQAGSFADDLPLDRPQSFHLAAWIVWAAALLMFLAWGGGLWRGKRIRALLNDETTLDHRRRALALGFWGAMGTAALVYGLSFYEPISARMAVRLVITFGVALALLRFGTLERKALKDG